MTLTALPELSVTTDKQRVVVRTARRFLGERHVGECPCRFDVLAIDNRPGMPPRGAVAQGRVQSADVLGVRTGLTAEDRVIVAARLTETG